MHAFISPAVPPYQAPPALIERVVQAETLDSGLIPMRLRERGTPVPIADVFSGKSLRNHYRLKIVGGAWILTNEDMATAPRARRLPLPKISARYVALAEKAGAYYHVSPALILAVIAQESSFRPHAESAAGAKGLMQLMPVTAQHMGVYNPFNPRQSIWGGTRYLAKLLHHYRGNVRLALAAYNAGITVVDADGRRIPGYGETRAYVPHVIDKYLAIINSPNVADGS